jgi:hypothetical protein
MLKIFNLSRVRLGTDRSDLIRLIIFFNLFNDLELIKTYINIIENNYIN